MDQYQNASQVLNNKLKPEWSKAKQQLDFSFLEELLSDAEYENQHNMDKAVSYVTELLNGDIKMFNSHQRKHFTDETNRLIDELLKKLVPDMDKEDWNYIDNIYVKNSNYNNWLKYVLLVDIRDLEELITDYDVTNDEIDDIISLLGDKLKEIRESIKIKFKDLNLDFDTDDIISFSKKAVELIQEKIDKSNEVRLHLTKAYNGKVDSLKFLKKEFKEEWNKAVDETPSPYQSDHYEWGGPEGNLTNAEKAFIEKIKQNYSTAAADEALTRKIKKILNRIDYLESLKK